jgi:hypothetical protein
MEKHLKIRPAGEQRRRRMIFNVTLRKMGAVSGQTNLMPKSKIMFDFGLWYEMLWIFG